jgi:hypothetical protein
MTKRNVLIKHPIKPESKKRPSVPICFFFRLCKNRKCIPTLISKANAPAMIHVKAQYITLPFMMPMMNNIAMAAVLVVSNKMFLVLILPILYNTKIYMSI